MTNSDKDFITRIQVSQLITDDPYGDDFYFHIMAAIRASRQPPLPGGPLGGPGQGGNNNNHRRPTRRDNAMQRMAQNVQRLVDSAKQRNKSGQRKSHFLFTASPPPPHQKKLCSSFDFDIINQSMLTELSERLRFELEALLDRCFRCHQPQRRRLRRQAMLFLLV